LTDSAQDGLECGGAYMKLLKDSKALHAEEFSNTSPYVIMFGPDKCGATNKVSPKRNVAAGHVLM
jgi:calnexin